jgi:roadblock/LC7 domain-containing protein
MATPTPVEIEINGETYKGSYSTDGHLLTTRYRMQAMTDEVRTTAPAIAARGMLARLVRLEQRDMDGAGGH